MTDITATGSATDSKARDRAPDVANNQMPPGIPYIVANEFAERFCYYGINAILAVYMTQHLQFGQAKATEWQSLFKFGAYFFPLIGAILSDVFWGKYRTIITLALVYCAGCTVLAVGNSPVSLAIGLGLMAVGTGGIKPCVSTNVGDQFTSKNAHLIERAFSYFYLSINAGSSISIFFTPVWLESYGPGVAFGVPAAMMFVATGVFWAGRRRFVVVPPAMAKNPNLGTALFALALVPVLGIALWVFNTVGSDYRTVAALFTLIGLLVLTVYLALSTGLRNLLPAELREWMVEAFTGPALKQITGLALIYYIFIAAFWALWDQSNGQTWTLQATSDFMDKRLFRFLESVPVLGALSSFEMLPAQIQVVNGLLILIMVPIFTFSIYPALAKIGIHTPLRKIGLGLWVVAASFLIIAYIEQRIMNGITTSLWWQIFAYVILTAAEVMVSITSMEFSYMQAPLRVKSFIMAATYLLAISLGNAFTAQVNSAMVKPLAATAITAGEETWVNLADVSNIQVGQKIDFEGDNGIAIVVNDADRKPLAGTFLIAEIDAAQSRVRLVDAIHSKPVISEGSYKADMSAVSTYRLVGPVYFLFFSGLAAAAALIFVFVAGRYREQTHVRPSEA